MHVWRGYCHQLWFTNAFSWQLNELQAPAKSRILSKLCTCLLCFCVYCRVMSLHLHCRQHLHPTKGGKDGKMMHIWLLHLLPVNSCNFQSQSPSLQRYLRETASSLSTHTDKSWDYSLLFSCFHLPSRKPFNCQIQVLMPTSITQILLDNLFISGTLKSNSVTLELDR